MMRQGKTLREIRNPLLSLPAAKAIEELDPEARKAIGRLLRELGRDANARAEESWTKGKGPMAAYWKAVGVYARHTARVVERKREPGECNCNLERRQSALEAMDAGHLAAAHGASCPARAA